MKPTFRFHVVCSECKDVVGLVREVEIKDRPGFFANVSDPHPMPTVCPKCKGTLVRVNN